MTRLSGSLQLLQQCSRAPDKRHNVCGAPKVTPSDVKRESTQFRSFKRIGGSRPPSTAAETNLFHPKVENRASLSNEATPSGLLIRFCLCLP